MTRPSPAETALSPEDRIVARIDALTRAGRANWLGLLAYLAFTMVTVLGVADADFFTQSRQTDLPVIGVAIPTGAFFAAAPILGAALHVYLHLLIRKSAEALARAPAQVFDAPLEAAILPWLLNDLVLRARAPSAQGAAIERRPLDWLAGVTAMLLIWVAAVYVLAFMWVKSLPAHDTGLSALIAVCVFFTVYASVQSWMKFRAEVTGQAWLAGRLASVLTFAVCATLLAGHLALTVLTTEGGVDRLTLVAFDDGSTGLPGSREMEVEHDPRPGWARGPLVAPALRALAARDLPGGLRDDRLLARADLAEVVFTALPADWLPYATHRERFRTDWCARQGLDPAVCGPAPTSDTAPDTAPPAHTDRRRAHWCRWNGYDDAGCAAYFATLEAGFTTVWRAERAAKRAGLDAWSAADADLRGADLSGAQFPAADLRRAELDGAQLAIAQLEGADLSGARLNGANLFGARLEGANLRFARLEGANLWAARLERADLSVARLNEADLTGAQLEGAYLGSARLEGADLREARLNRADLRIAQLEGADLFGAGLEGAALSYARMEGADLSYAGLEGADLSGARLDERTDFSVETLRGAALKSVTLTMERFDPDRLAEAFGNGSVTLPEGWVAGEGRLAHWPTADLYANPSDQSGPFYDEWRAWQADPEGYVPPQRR